MGSEKKPTILVAGCGLAGYAAVTALHRQFGREISLLVVDKASEFTWYPHLTSFLGGCASSSDVMISFSRLLPSGVTFIHDTIKYFDFSQQQVVCDGHMLHYDYVVVALGSKPDFSTVPVPEQGVFTLASYSDYELLKGHVAGLVQGLRQYKDFEPHKKDMTFVVVGGDAEGISLAVSLARFVRALFSKGNVNPTLLDVTLVEKDGFLVSYPESVQHYVRDYLRALHIDIIDQNRVVRIDNERVYLHDGRSLATSTVVWSARRIPRTVHSKLGKQGVVVTPFLRSKDVKQVYALGDSILQSFALDEQAHCLRAHISAELFGGETVLYQPTSFPLMIPLGRDGVFQEGEQFFVGSSGGKRVAQYEKEYLQRITHG